MFRRLSAVTVTIFLLSCVVCDALTFNEIRPTLNDNGTITFRVLTDERITTPTMYYLGFYNQQGRMVMLKNSFLDSGQGFILKEVEIPEYPLTVKAFAWSSDDCLTPFAETIQIVILDPANDDTLNKVIQRDMKGFVDAIGGCFSRPMPENPKYELAQRIITVGNSVLNDSYSNIITREFLEKKYEEDIEFAKDTYYGMDEDTQSEFQDQVAPVLDQYKELRNMFFDLFGII